MMEQVETELILTEQEIIKNYKGKYLAVTPIKDKWKIIAISESIENICKFIDTSKDKTQLELIHYG